jgi:hypothetical protein
MVNWHLERSLAIFDVSSLAFKTVPIIPGALLRIGGTWRYEMRSLQSRLNGGARAPQRKRPPRPNNPTISTSHVSSLFSANCGDPAFVSKRQLRPSEPDGLPPRSIVFPLPFGEPSQLPALGPRSDRAPLPRTYMLRPAYLGTGRKPVIPHSVRGVKPKVLGVLWLLRPPLRRFRWSNGTGEDSVPGVRRSAPR